MMAAEVRLTGNRQACLALCPRARGARPSRASRRGTDTRDRAPRVHPDKQHGAPLMGRLTVRLRELKPGHRGDAWRAGGATTLRERMRRREPMKWCEHPSETLLIAFG